MKKTAFFILLIMCACSGPEESEYEMINLRNAFTQPGELSVRDLGEHVAYVPLETTDESLIGDRAYVRMLKDKLLVASSQQPIKMFDRKTGKFIRTVGNIGAGANEYPLFDEGLPVFWIDDAIETIYVKTKGYTALRFDGEGSPLPSVSLPELLVGGSQITTENNLYVYKQTLFEKPDYKIFRYNIDNQEKQNYFLNEDEVILDSSSQLLTSYKFGNIPATINTLVFVLKDDQIFVFYPENPCLWAFDRQVYFKEYFNDTIYHIAGDQVHPRLVFNLGDKHWSYEDRYKGEGNQNKIVIKYILEGKNSLFFAFQTNYHHLDQAKNYLGVYNKRDKSVKVTDKTQIKDPDYGFFNGMLHSATANGELVGLIDAEDFMEEMNGKHLFDLSEEDNPVVVIIN